MKLFGFLGKKKTESDKIASPSEQVSAVVDKRNDVAPAIEVKNTTSSERPFTEGLVGVADIIAPGAIEVDWDFLRIDSRYYRTLFVSGYPRFVGMNWLSGLINFDASLSISMYIYPTDGKAILDDLRRKIAEMEAELTTDIQRGKIVNPATQAKLEDALTLQADLVKGEERFFQFGLYVTVSAKDKDELNKITKNLESSLGALLITCKKATLEMESGFTTTLPTCNDTLSVTRNMDTTSLASTFPFVSSDLSDDKGIMYGINQHNGSLVIFDRFSMPNYNSVVFASAGSGKSYMVKLEAMRSLMFGTEVIVIDPENEYRDLCEAVGGQYIAFGYGEDSKINPFDLSLVADETENALNDKILGLHKLFKVMIGDLDPIEESILDRAIVDAYKMKGVTPDPETQTREPPLIEDLYKSLLGMEDEKAKVLVARFEKYIKGSFAGIFNQKTTVNLKSNFVVFGIRNLEESLRPVAMHIILDYIWTIVKKTLKRRILVVDEAWYMMQFADSAAFLRGIVKRGRKYYLATTTITQDVGDFINAPYGKDIITNSAIQILLKQHSAAIDLVGQTFFLSEGEKQLLLSADKGEGIFFAGSNHVAMKVIASPEEHALITSNPEEVLKLKDKAKALKMAGLADVVNPGITNNQYTNNQNSSNQLKINKPSQNNTITNIPTSKEEPKTIPPAPYVGGSNAQSSSDQKPVAPVIKQEEGTVIATPAEQVSTVADKRNDKETVGTHDHAFLQEDKKAEEVKIELKTEIKMEDRRGMQAVEVTEKVPAKVVETPAIHEELAGKIAQLEAHSKSLVENHQRQQDEEGRKKEEEKLKQEEERKKVLNSLPKYQDLFKSPSSNSNNKLPPLPPLPPLPKSNNTTPSVPTSKDDTGNPPAQSYGATSKSEVISKIETKTEEISKLPVNIKVVDSAGKSLEPEKVKQEVAENNTITNIPTSKEEPKSIPPTPYVGGSNAQSSSDQKPVAPVIKQEEIKVEAPKAEVNQPVPQPEKKPDESKKATPGGLTYEDLFGKV